MDKTSGKLQVEQNQWSVKKKKYSWIWRLEVPKRVEWWTRSVTARNKSAAKRLVCHNNTNTRETVGKGSRPTSWEPPAQAYPSSEHFSFTASSPKHQSRGLAITGSRWHHLLREADAAQKSLGGAPFRSRGRTLPICSRLFCVEETRPHFLRNYGRHFSCWAGCMCALSSVWAQLQSIMRHVVTSFVAPLAPPFFPTLSRKRHDCRKTVLHIKCVFWFPLQLLTKTFLILRI